VISGTSPKAYPPAFPYSLYSWVFLIEEMANREAIDSLFVTTAKLRSSRGGQSHFIIGSQGWETLYLTIPKVFMNLRMVSTSPAIHFGNSSEPM